MDVRLVLRSLKIVISEIKTYLNNQQTMHEAERHSAFCGTLLIPIAFTTP